MKKTLLSKAVGLSLLASLIYTTPSIAQEKPVDTNSSFDFSKMNDTQKQQLGNFISDYLMANPDILVKMSDKIQIQPTFLLFIVYIVVSFSLFFTSIKKSRSLDVLLLVIFT